MFSKVDLHIHSNHSDGRFSPEKIVSIAAVRRLRTISITDHDNVFGASAALKIGKKIGIEVIPGIELSVKKDDRDLHLLGYYIDIDYPQILSYIEFFREERLKRAQKIIEKLDRLHVHVGLEEVMSRANGAPICRVHIADVIIKKGYARNIHEVFQTYIGDTAPASVPKFKIYPEEAIQLIADAGGLSFIAHPGSDISPVGILELNDVGLNGIETIHSRHNQSQQLYYHKLAAHYNLLESGGSDCHGDDMHESLIGKLHVPEEFVNKIKAYREYIQPTAISSPKSYRAYEMGKPSE